MSPTKIDNQIQSHIYSFNELIIMWIEKPQITATIGKQ